MQIRWKMANEKWQIQRGFTLLEILVVVSIFAVLGILVARAVILSVGGSKKSESLVRVRENLDYSIGIIGRSLRNANSITPCPNSDASVLNYVDRSGNTTAFSCNLGIPPGYVASGSARLTASNINVTACSLSCAPAAGSTNPSVVTVSLTAKDATAVGIQGAEVSITTSVSLRNY